MGILSNLLVRAAPSRRAYSLACVNFFGEQMFIETLLHAKLEVWGSVLLLVNMIDEERALKRSDQSMS